ncbi:cytidine deaminase [Nocardioides sp. zg-579]|uniref:Cytidine deaminase n=1 Tax=Nocardioides marmotae TaxID=2663857 RepID=A0A6I3JGC9_9ACTN|nr:cytidine deaminase [Nocardioides marmotae]MCR6033559.1 cytidine deaminase [Gordonia jinghuaiqii]MTB97217.1 cytidine deaminase [Nocardioides marmotae]QKE02132.1 cytidine deaminase [Nocardioides marmotae]
MTDHETSSETSSETSAEDRKLVTLARATRARTRTAEGAAVRDADGRTYAAATVDLPSLQVSALGVCVAMAVASGATGLEAAVVLTEADALAATDLGALRDLGGAGVVVHRGDPRGTLVETTTT